MQAAGEVDGHGELRRAQTPGRQPRLIGEQMHGTAGVEAACQGGAGIEAEALMVESASATAGVDVRFQDGDIQPVARQHSRGSQPADARADDDDFSGRIAGTSRHETLRS